MSTCLCVCTHSLAKCLSIHLCVCTHHLLTVLLNVCLSVFCLCHLPIKLHPAKCLSICPCLCSHLLLTVLPMSVYLFASLFTPSTHSWYMMTPAAHISTGRPYPGASWNMFTMYVSGATNNGVPRSSKTLMSTDRDQRWFLVIKHQKWAKRKDNMQCIINTISLG